LPAVFVCAPYCAWAQKIVRLATTTSTDNSGLLTALLPAFEAATKITVHVIAVGSGKALALARNGDVDVVLVHAKAAEDQFIAALAWRQPARRYVE
jgi:tungstate transport system substrate-binding protein